MNVSSLNSSSVTQASTARAADGDYKTKGIGHEVKDADGDYKPTKPNVSMTAPVLASASSGVQNVLLGLVKGGA